MEPTFLLTKRTDLEKVVYDAVRDVMLDVLRQAIKEARTKDWLNRDEVCSFYGLTPRQLTYMRTKGSIEYTKHGRRILYSRESLEEWINRGKVRPRGSMSGDKGQSSGTN